MVSRRNYSGTGRGNETGQGGRRGTAGEADVWPRRVRNAFILERRLYDLRIGGSADYWPTSEEEARPSRSREMPEKRRSRTPPWPKIAQQALDHGIDPVEFVVWCFFLWPLVDQAPFPTQLIGDAAVGRYHQADGRLAEVVPIWWSGKKSQIEFEANWWEGASPGLSPEKRLNIALLDPKHASHPIVGYCLASSWGPAFSSAAAALEEAAALEYVRMKRAFDRAWGAKIPARLKTVAATLYHEVFDRGLARDDRDGNDRAQMTRHQNTGCVRPWTKQEPSDD